MLPGDIPLILLALAAIGLLVLLVVRVRLDAFVALLIATLVVGAGATVLAPATPAGPVPGYSIGATLQSIQTGLGATLGGITPILGIGVLLGGMLAASGAAPTLAAALGAHLGPRRVGTALLILGVLVGLATWFAVGLVLLAPLLLAAASRPGAAPLRLMLPVLAALSLTHGLLPPHPGPVVAQTALGVDAGRILLWGTVVGLPTLLLAGPILARWLEPRVAFQPAGPVTTTPPTPPGGADPTPAASLTVMLLPVVLMLGATIAPPWLGSDHSISRTLAVAGHPTLALLIALGAGLRLLRPAGPDGSGILRNGMTGGLAGVGTTLLVVGAGGAFARVLRDAGIADALGRAGSLLHLPPLVYGWLLAVFVRVATGSATVAITTAAGLLAPVLAAHPETSPDQRALLVVALGSGSLCLSHLNDGGFWIVKDCLGLSVGQTLRTWTVCETAIGVLGLGFAWLCSGLLP